MNDVVDALNAPDNH